MKLTRRLTLAAFASALAAQELEGSLSVQSEGPGLGATFTLELPFRPA